MRRVLADGIEVDDDAERTDIDAVHDYLANESYWAEGRPRELPVHDSLSVFWAQSLPGGRVHPQDNN